LFYMFEFFVCNTFDMCISVMDTFYLTDYSLPKDDGTKLVPGTVTTTNTKGELAVVINWVANA